MKTIVVCKADGTAGIEVEPVVIEITAALPRGEREWSPHWVADAKQQFRVQAALIRDGLNALPGGTKGALLSLLLEDAASVRRVP